LFGGDHNLNKFTLDKITTDRALILNRFDLHAILVNSKFLEISKIDSENAIASEGGKIDYFEEGEFKGQLTGLFHDSATKIVLSKIPEIPKEEKIQILKDVNKYMISQGVTAFMDACVSYELFQIYKELYQNKSLTKNLARAALSISPKKLFFDIDDSDDNHNNSKII